MKIVHISIKKPPVNSEVLVYLKNIESPAHLRYSMYSKTKNATYTAIVLCQATFN
jgi:hypothetical protein